MRSMVGAVLAGVVAVGSLGCSGDDDSGASEQTTATSGDTAAASTRRSAPPATGSDSSVPPAETTTAIGTASTEAAGEWPPPQDELDAAVLTIGDMPTGWATVTADDDSGPPCDAGLSDVLGVDEDDLPQGEFIAAEDEQFGPLLGNFVTVLSPDAPDDVMTEWRNRMLECDDEFNGFDVSYSELSFPPIGDEMIATRLNLTSDEGSGHYDMMVVRTGDIVVALQAYDQFGDATALLTEYGQLAVDRATGALS